MFAACELQPPVSIYGCSAFIPYRAQGLCVDEVFTRVTDDVMHDTRNEQNPALYVDKWGSQPKNTVLFPK